MYPGNFEFASYLFDVSTGLHYADQRYYNGTYGRFMSADPSRRTATGNDSASWNKYSYTRGDPINRIDPQGLADFYAEGVCGAACKDSRGGGGSSGNENYVNYEVDVGDPKYGGGVGGAPDYGDAGGGRATIKGESIKFLAGAKAGLQAALNFWMNCDKVLGKKALDYAKNKISFENLGTSVSGAFAITEIGSNGKPTGVIGLFDNFYGIGSGTSFADQAEVLVHELIHAAFNFTKPDHSDVITRFNIPTSGFNSNSIAIDAWIGRDCQ